MSNEKNGFEIIGEEITGMPRRVAEYEDIEPDEPDVFQRIKAFCDSGDSNGSLGLYRAVPNSRKENFVATIDGSDFAPEIIKERFGGGDFIIKAYDDKSKIRLKQHLSIEGEPILTATRPQYPTLAPQSAPPALDMAAIMQMMQENNRQMLAGIVQIMRPAQDSAPSRADMLNEMMTMKQIFSSGDGGSNATEMLLKGIELAKSLAPSGNGETSGLDIVMESIKSFGPALGQIVAQSAKQQRATQQPITQAKQHPESQLQQQPQLDAPKIESEEDMLFKYYLAMLVGFAAENRDPALYADLIADNLPEEKLNEICNDPDIIGTLSKTNPDVLSHRVWFESVILELKAIMGLTEPTITANVSATINLDGQNAPIGSGSPTENENNGNV